MLRQATDGLNIGERNGVAGPGGDRRDGDGGGQSGAGTGAGHHGVDDTQLAGGGDGGWEQGKETKRRRISRTTDSVHI